MIIINTSTTLLCTSYPALCCNAFLFSSPTLPVSPSSAASLYHKLAANRVRRRLPTPLCQPRPPHNNALVSRVIRFSVTVRGPATCARDQLQASRIRGSRSTVQRSLRPACKHRHPREASHRVGCRCLLLQHELVRRRRRHRDGPHYEPPGWPPPPPEQSHVALYGRNTANGTQWAH